MGLFAQEAVRQIISIDEMFSLADKNSKSLRPFTTGIKESQQAVKEAKNARLPELKASVSVSYLGNAYLMDRDFSNGINAPMPHFGNNFSVEASQVIYAGGAISSSIEMAKLHEKSAEASLETSRNNTRFLLVGYYLDMFKCRNMLRVYEKNIEQTQQVIKDLQAKQNEGIVLKNDITRYELMLSNLTLAHTQMQNTLSILNNNLVTSLGLPSNTRIEPDTTILLRVVPIENKEHWTNTAYEKSPVLKQVDLVVQMAEQENKLTKSAYYPTLALFAGNHLDGPIVIEVPPIDKNLNYWQVGISLSYDLSSLYKTKKSTNRSKLAMQRSAEQYDHAKEQIELAVDAAYIKYLEAYEQFNTQQKSVELANQNYAVISNRYKNDMALISDMLDASNSKLDAELQLTNAQINIIFNYYKLKQAAGNL
jgi:outer membrane protein TolC